MTTADALNRKAQEQYEMAQRGQAISSQEAEATLFKSLFGPQRHGGRRSKSLSDMPYEGRTAGVYVPEWLRSRLEQWFQAKYPEHALPNRRPKVRTMILLALYEVSRGYKAPEEETKAVRSIKAAAEGLRDDAQG